MRHSCRLDGSPVKLQGTSAPLRKTCKSKRKIKRRSILNLKANQGTSAIEELPRNPTQSVEQRGRDSTLATPSAERLPMSSSARLEPVCKDGRRVCTQSGHMILQDVSEAFTLRQQTDLAAGVVLQFDANEESSHFDVGLGLLQCNRYLACARIKVWWMTPEWGKSADSLPPETQFLLLELGNQGPYAIVLPLIDQNRFRCTLAPPRKGQDPDDLLRLVIESNNAAVRSSQFKSTLLIAASYDPYQLTNQAVAAAARLSGTSKARVDKVAPKILNYFGWCTWDAFYSTISAEGIQQGLQAFKDGGVQPKFLIIDDGWQSSAADESTNETPAEKQARKDLLDKSGAGGNYITNTFQTQSGSPETQQQPAFFTKLLGGAIARAQTILQSALFAFYKRYVEQAEASSWSISVFSILAAGPLKGLLLDYYNLTSDHTQRLQSVKANGKFSSIQATGQTSMSQQEDLKSIVMHCKEQFGVKLVYAWHSLHGYWGGLAPRSTAMPYNVRVVTPTLTPGILTVDPCFAWSQFIVAGVGIAADVKRVYKDMHAYLKGAGVDGVKVDSQGLMGMTGGGAAELEGGPAITAQYHAALENSVSQHFPGNNCINCMCHSTEDIYRMESTVIARSSDDFWPRDPASHTTHVAVNAYNSLFMGALIQPDWDMFHSLHPAALLHATARVISGGPIYVSDKPNQHDFSLLRRLVLCDGTVVRCSSIGLPTLDTLFADPMRDNKSVLKVWNPNKHGAALALFNLQGSSWSRTARKFVTHNDTPATLKTLVSPSDIPHFKQLEPDTEFIVYSDHQNHVWTLGLGENIPLSLSSGSSDMLAIVPLQRNNDVAFAAIGLVNLLSTNATVLDSEVATIKEDILSATVKVKGHGDFLAYCSRRPQRCCVNGQDVKFDYNSKNKTMRCTTNQLENLIELQY